MIFFLNTHIPLLSSCRTTTGWPTWLADVFSQLNGLIVNLQGDDKTVLQMNDRISGFMQKIDLWLRKCEVGDVTSFPQLDRWLSAQREAEYTIDSKIAPSQTIQ